MPVYKVYSCDSEEIFTVDDNSILHNAFGPAVVRIVKGCKVKEEWYLNGKLHRESGPARIYTSIGGYDKNVNIHEWYYEGKLHCDSGPAVIEYDFNDNILNQTWYLDGKLHRDSGPACINTFPIESECWFKNGVKHNETGPAFVRKGHQEYYLHGKMVSKDELANPI